MKFTATILALIVFASGSIFAFGCVLAPGPVPGICERFWEGDAVALATVASIQKTGYKRLVTLRVSEVFRGDPPLELTFEDLKPIAG